MTLAEYLRQHDLNATQFAAQIGVSISAAWRYAEGKRRPGTAIMLRIVEATDGAVGPADFYPSRPGKGERQGAA